MDSVFVILDYEAIPCSFDPTSAVDRLFKQRCIFNLHYAKVLCFVHSWRRVYRIGESGKKVPSKVTELDTRISVVSV